MVNGKGGSGASFLATNFAHSLVLNENARVTLVDLDLQFGGLYRYLDVTPKVGLLQALEAAHELDAPGLAASAGVDLRLDDPQIAAEVLGRFHRIVRRVGRMTRRHRNSVARK